MNAPQGGFGAGYEDEGFDDAGDDPFLEELEAKLQAELPVGAAVLVRGKAFDDDSVSCETAGVGWARNVHRLLRTNTPCRLLPGSAKSTRAGSNRPTFATPGR